MCLLRQCVLALKASLGCSSSGVRNATGRLPQDAVCLLLILPRPRTGWLKAFAKLLCTSNAGVRTLALVVASG
jgi:hypothetical protein